MPNQIPNPNDSEKKAERRQIVRAATLAGVLIGLLAAVYLSPLRHHLTDVRQIRDRIDEIGPLAPLAFLLVSAALIAAGVPRLILCPIGGMTFGFWMGLLWTQLGAFLGYYLMFLFVRWGGGRFLIQRWPKLNRLALKIHSHGILAVILMRQMPIHGSLINVVLGLTPVRHRDFLLGTAVGLLPEAIPCTLIGTGALQGSFHHSAAYILAAMGILVVVWLGFGVLLHRVQKARRPIVNEEEVLEVLEKDSQQ